jgi:predicted 3-demethylubiquinone-9 3-methyltransferase (glyoxalase superfamily)
MSTINKIAPNLWFDRQAEEAANFYVSVFKNSKVTNISRYGKAGFEFHQMPEGTVMTIEFELDGQKFVGLNGGPVFKFSEATSFIIYCDTQEEIDYYWNKLTEGGDERSQQCGWLKDKFGVSWQVVPTILSKLVKGESTERSERVMNAMMPMKKLDIAKLEEAAKG